ncbi:MAG TPA: SusC/RagA family TonB-linked outer membrane protein, partial [Sphingobacteriaceae bacterium]
SELKPSTTENRYLSGKGRTLEDYRNLKGIDWQGLLFEEPLTQIYNLSVRGGNPQTKYSISGNIFEGQGIVIETGSKRYQGRATIDHEVSKFLKVGANVNKSFTEAYGTSASAGAGSGSTSYLFYNGWGYRPVTGDDAFDLISEDVDEENITAFELRVNPIKTAQNDYRRYYTNTLTSVIFADFNFTKDLKLRVSGNFNERTQTNDVFYNSKTTRGSPKNLSNIRGINGATGTTDYFTWSNENVLTYSKTFNKTHKLNAIGGFSSQKSKREATGVAVQNLPNEELGMSGFDEGEPYAATATSANYTLTSFFGRLHYNLNSKYTIEGTFRADGSSKFAAGNKWGYFPSGSIAWNLKAEPWMTNFRLLSTTKLRASYGVTGNNRVREFDYLPGIDFPNIASYSFNNSTPTKAAIPGLGNEDLTWERTHQLDIGLDLGLFKDKVNLTVDYYNKSTKDLLLFADVPLYTGYSRIYQNIGELNNRGLELSLTTNNIKTKTFSWSSNANISFNRNKIVSLVDNQTSLFTTLPFETQYNNSPLYIARVGESAAKFYGYIFDGVYQYEDFNDLGGGNYLLKPSVATNGNERTVIQPGDIKYRDLNGDGVVDSYDQTIIGNGMPLHVGGLSNNFQYKNFGLNVFFQWSYGNDIMNANRLVLEGNGLQRTDLNQYASYVDRWSPENQTNRNYRAGGQGPLGRYSSRTIEDGSYLRLKTLSFSYAVPAKVVKKIRMSKLALTMAAQNLVTWSDYSGWDPEVSVRNSVLTPGFDYSAYPQARTLVFGLNASF